MNALISAHDTVVGTHTPRAAEKPLDRFRTTQNYVYVRAAPRRRRR